MSPPKTKPLFINFIKKVIKTGRLDLADKYVTAHIIDHDPVAAEADKVVVRLTATGTQMGEFVQHEPTDKSFPIAAIDIMLWGQSDRVGMMRQPKLPEGGNDATPSQD